MAETKVDSTSPSVATGTTSYPATKSSGTGITLCVSYFKTGPGIIKLVELVSKLHNHHTQLHYSSTMVDHQTPKTMTQNNFQYSPFAA